MAVTNLIPGVLVEFAWRGQAVRFFARNLADSIQSVHTNGAFYEEHELAIIERHFPPGGVFLDVGANVGNHAVFVAKFCRPGQVILVEPNPDAAVLLRINLLLNRLELDTSALGVGLSDREAAAEAATPRNNLGGTRMLKQPTGRIRLVTGDSLFANRPIDFIKLDVEGGEMAALAGLDQTISASRPRMFVEVDNANREAFDAWCAAHDYQVAETFRRYAGNENHMVLPKPGTERRRDNGPLS